MTQFIELHVSQPQQRNGWTYVRTLLAVDVIKMVQEDYTHIDVSGDYGSIVVIGGEFYRVKETYKQVRELILNGVNKSAVNVEVDHSRIGGVSIGYSTKPEDHSYCGTSCTCNLGSCYPVDA